MLKKIAHSIPFFLTLGLLLPVAGFRHLWQDEVETAERSRSVAEAGLPRFVDSQGRISVNAAGQELEEGVLHRYTPWGQFYLGAGGLLAGKALGFTEDASLRAPFIVSHALTSSLVSFGLTAFGGLPVAVGVGVGTLFGVQTVRVLHNRTARYHGVLELLTVLGMLGLGMISRGDKRGRALLAGSIFLLPHFHSIGGGLMSSLLGLAALLFYREWRTVVVSWALSLAALLALTRPWVQEAWNKGGEQGFRSLLSVFEISYAFIFLVAAIIFFFLKGAKRFAGTLLLLFVWAVLFVRLGDLHPYSQIRYYLALPVFFLFWPIALPWPKGVAFPKKAVCYAIFAAVILPEFLGAFPPGWGMRVVAADWGMRSRGERQPLHQAFDMIRASENDGGVIVDYVPQFANWYLRTSSIALMPDRAVKTKVNANNPLWSTPLIEPQWHLSYPTKLNGSWVCAPNCDYRAGGLTPTSARYELVSGALKRKFEMCVVARWITDSWNNAPFAEYERAALSPEGLRWDMLVLAVRCARSSNSAATRFIGRHDTKLSGKIWLNSSTEARREKKRNERPSPP